MIMYNIFNKDKIINTFINESEIKIENTIFFF